MFRIGTIVAATAAVLFGAGAAQADLAPPPGALIDVAAISPTTIAAYTKYSANFTAAYAATTVSFLFRRDPSYFAFDDASVTLAGNATNLLVDGGFELGTVGSQNPFGWGNFQQTTGIGAQGVTQTGNGRGGEGAHSGVNFWDDGAVGAYDGIFQSIATVVGQTYTLSFWLANPSTGSAYSQTGSGIDALAYVGNSVPGGTVITNPAPPTTGAVPEPATWAMMLVGFGAIGIGLRRRARPAVRVSFG